MKNRVKRFRKVDVRRFDSFELVLNDSSSSSKVEGILGGSKIHQGWLEGKPDRNQPVARARQGD